MERLNKLNKVIDIIKGSSFSVESPIIDGDKAIVKLDTDLAKLDKNTNQHELKKDDIKNYWLENDQIKRSLNEGAFKLLLELPFINTVKLTLNFENKDYTIELNRNDFEKYVKKDFDSISNNWQAEFSDRFVHDENGRREFFNTFTAIH